MQIGLALSGRGYPRPAVFHLGVIRRLAEQELLESISVISTVSGGSLVLAALVSRAGMIKLWPSRNITEITYIPRSGNYSPPGRPIHPRRNRVAGGS